jgi:hypothetical protein
MKSLRSLTAAAVVSVVALSPAGPAAADVHPLPPCSRDILLAPLFQAEGTLSLYETGFTWFAFNVRSQGCITTGATVVFKTVHLSTDDDDLIAEDGVSITWPAGDRTNRVVYVRVIKDGDVEPNERFVLKTVCAESTNISEGVAATAWVLNDDGETPSAQTVPYNYHCKQ